MIVSVYDTEGAEHQKEMVDARECCQEMGWSINPPVEAVKPKQKRQQEKAE